MYLNLGKKKASARKVTVQDSPSGATTPNSLRQRSSDVIIDGQPVALDLLDPRNRPQSPYAFFYPEEVVPQVGTLNTSDMSATPQFKERTDQRTRKQAFVSDQAVAFERFSTSNLVTVHKALMQFTASDGSISRVNFLSALQSIGCLDRPILERTFDLFDVRRDGIVEYKEIIAALDVIVNGTNKGITHQDCFNLFDPTNCGYIIQPCLRDIKLQRVEGDGINHMMVKVLLELFDRMQAEEEDRMKKEWAKKTRKRPAPKAKKSEPAGAEPPKQAKEAPKKPATMPAYAKKIHMSFKEFSDFFAAEPLLVQAFLTRILQTMEAVYLRNKKATQAAYRRVAGDTASDVVTDSARSELYSGAYSPQRSDRSPHPAPPSAHSVASAPSASVPSTARSASAREP